MTESRRSGQLTDSGVLLSLMGRRRYGEKFLESLPVGFQRLMREWQRVASLSGWRNSHDNPWWYGERASVSQLAGAAWWLNCWAMQDYIWKRGRADALIDLCVSHTARTRMAGLHFIAEAKPVYLELWRNREGTIRRWIKAALKAARKQLNKVAHDDYARVTLVFITPTLDAPRSLPNHDGPLMRALESLELPYVWAFPYWAEAHRAFRRRYYPGAVLVADYRPATR